MASASGTPGAVRMVRVMSLGESRSRETSATRSRIVSARLREQVGHIRLLQWPGTETIWPVDRSRMTIAPVQQARTLE